VGRRRGLGDVAKRNASELGQRRHPALRTCTDISCVCRRQQHTQAH
jgi:hypothetical protein